MFNQNKGLGAGCSKVGWRLPAVSARLFISKLQRSKLLSIQTRFLKKHFQTYKQAVRKFALNFRLTLG
jgi:hypothetical protein